MYSQKNIDNFWKKVKKLETGLCCWEWQACLSSDGYGNFKVNGKMIGAHRFSFQLHHNRLIEDGMCIMHFVCDNRKCVNPAHLKEGTKQDNSTDMVNKGRGNGPKGEKQHLSKLTEKQVLEIREKYSQGGTTHQKLGDEYGVQHSTISDIVNYKLWTHI
jgi:hypothetical protein